MVLWQVLAAVGVLVGGGAGFGTGIYAADYEVPATIVGKSCAGPVPPGMEGPDAQSPGEEPSGPSSGTEAPESTDPSLPAAGENSTVTVRPRVFGIPFEVEVTEFPNDKCWPLRAGEDGNFVTVNIRTQKAVFYEREGGPCIFHTVFGPGCVLPEFAEETQRPEANARFTLSTTGYTDTPDTPVPSSANCVTIPADGADRVHVNATWQATATDGSLRLVVEALADGATIASQESTGPSVLSATVELTGADSYRIAMYPDGEVVGSTSSIVIDVQATGTDDIPSASPAPC